MARNHDKGFVTQANYLIDSISLAAISRTMDYHHWKEDVGVGSIIGLLISFMCYRQYFPSISSKKSNLCYEMQQSSSGSSEDLLEKEIKWI